MKTEVNLLKILQLKVCWCRIFILELIYFFLSKLKMSESRYFYITNDPHPEEDVIQPGDAPDVIERKKTHQLIKDRVYATYDETTKMWSIPLPDFFRNSTNPNKNIYIESFQFFNSSGQSDIGTTIHSPSLMDGNYSQFDNIVGLATLGINREFPIQSNLDKIDFFFADYMDYTTRLDAVEYEQTIKKDALGNILYLNIREDKTQPPTTNVTVHPVVDNADVAITNNDLKNKVNKGKVICWLAKDEVFDVGNGVVDPNFNWLDENNMRLVITMRQLQSGNYFPVPLKWTNHHHVNLTINPNTRGVYTYMYDLKTKKRDFFNNAFQFNRDYVVNGVAPDQAECDEEFINENWPLYKVNYTSFFPKYIRDDQNHPDNARDVALFAKFNRDTFYTHQITMEPITEQKLVQRVDNNGQKLYYQTIEVEETIKRGQYGREQYEQDLNNPKPIRFFIIAKLNY